MMSDPRHRNLACDHRAIDRHECPKSQYAESRSLEKAIRSDLEGLGYGS